MAAQIPPSSTSRWTLRAGLLMLVLLAALATRIRFTSDLGAFLPQEGEVAEALALLDEFGLIDAMLVEVDGRGVPRAQLLAEVDRLGAELAADPRLAEVRWRVGPQEAIAVQVAIAPLAVRLMPAALIEARTRPEGIREGFRAWMSRLSMPMGGMFKEGLRWDPLDLTTLAAQHVQGSAAPFHMTVEDGHFFDNDLERALIFLRAGESALSVGVGDGLTSDLTERFQRGALPIRWFGGHRIAAASARMVKRDIIRSLLLGGLALSAVLAFAFKNPRAMNSALLAPLVGLLAAAAAGALWGPVHAFTGAFAAAIAGISVDYWVHLYAVAASMEGEGRGSGERLEVGQRALREINPSLLLSAGSTAVAFLVLTLSSYPLIAQLGIMGAAAITGSLAGTILLGPWVFARIGGTQIRDLFPARPPRWLGLVVGAISLLGLALLPASRFDGDPRSLNAVPAEIASVEADFSQRYGAFGSAGLVVVEGATLDEALDRSDRVVDALGNLEGVTISGLDRVLPGPTRVQARLAALPPTGVLQARIDAAAEEAGVRTESVAGVSARLHGDPPAPLGLSTWAGTPLEELVRSHLDVQPDLTRAMASLTVAEEGQLAKVQATLAQVDPTARLVMGSLMAARGVEALKRDMTRLSGFALALVLGVLTLRYRSPRRILAAAAPPLLAIVWTNAVMVLLGRPWNAVSGGAMVLVLGLSLDYGVFIVDSLHRAQPLPARRAVAVGLITSVVGTGSLLSADNPAIFSFGLAMSVGLGAAGLVALVLSPWLAGERRSPAT